jgi:hypothetical protein
MNFCAATTVHLTRGTFSFCIRKSLNANFFRLFIFNCFVSDFLQKAQMKINWKPKKRENFNPDHCRNEVNDFLLQLRTYAKHERHSFIASATHPIAI